MPVYSFVIGAIFLLAGLYQVLHPYLGGLRVAGVIDVDSEPSADDVSSPESLFATVVGLGLIVIGLLFLGLWALNLSELTGTVSSRSCSDKPIPCESERLQPVFDGLSCGVAETV